MAFLIARLRVVFAFLLAGAAAIGHVTTATGDEPAIRFATDIVPILTKHACNSGGCHGKAAGQNGFKLSLLGFEPEADYLAIVKEARGRRIFPANAGHSLLLLKATGQTPHGGGRRLDEAGDDSFDVAQPSLRRRFGDLGDLHGRRLI